MPWRRLFSESASQNVPVQPYYDLDEAPTVDGKTWKLEVRGLVENRKSWTLEELYQLPQSSRSRATSASRAGARSEAGPARRLRDFLKLIGADTAPNMSGSSARTRTDTIAARHGDRLHAQTQMTFKFGDEILPAPTVFR